MTSEDWNLVKIWLILSVSIIASALMLRVMLETLLT